MQEFIDFVHNFLEDRRITPEEQLQLNKIDELENKFLNGFSEEKWNEYFELEKQKGQLRSIETDLIIEFVYKLSKNLFN